MYQGFPRRLIPKLRCPVDGAALAFNTDGPPHKHVWNGQLECRACARNYSIVNGIATFLDVNALDSESANELNIRDLEGRRCDHDWELTEWEQAEIVPTIKASGPLRGAEVLELGAGTGRYTVLMAKRGASLVAVDFSLASLGTLARRLDSSWEVGLVLADCTKLEVAAASFDLVASTLIANLPTSQHRAQVMRLAASALTNDGKFIFSTHHYDLRSRLRREPQSGRYREGGIYRYLFQRHEIETEVEKFFAHVKCRPIRIAVPLTSRIGFSVAASRLTERLWFLNRFGQLLLVCARGPGKLSGGDAH